MNAQKSEQKLREINSISAAENYIKNHPQDDGQIFTLSPEIEGENVVVVFANKKVGDIFSQNENTYKILSCDEIRAFRVSYIFFDENKMSLTEINKKRSEILNDYKKGKSFSDLANANTMDSNKDGDLDWFAQGMMVPEFESSVKNHNLNDIFIVDIPYNQWYYIVLKTFDDRKINRLTILRIKSGS